MNRYAEQLWELSRIQDQEHQTAVAFNLENYGVLQHQVIQFGAKLFDTGDALAVDCVNDVAFLRLIAGVRDRPEWRQQGRRPDIAGA